VTNTVVENEGEGKERTKRKRNQIEAINLGKNEQKEKKHEWYLQLPASWGSRGSLSFKVFKKVFGCFVWQKLEKHE
jgi:hypothetical protein